MAQCLSINQWLKDGSRFWEVWGGFKRSVGKAGSVAKIRAPECCPRQEAEAPGTPPIKQAGSSLPRTDLWAQPHQSLRGFKRICVLLCGVSHLSALQCWQLIQIIYNRTNKTQLWARLNLRLPAAAPVFLEVWERCQGGWKGSGKGDGGSDHCKILLWVFSHENHV